MRQQKRGVIFNCFSPPIMLATLVLEFGLAIYSVWRYKMTTITRLIMSLLVALATFQLAEFFVCTGYAHHASLWSRLGFVAISTLPALGIHAIHVLADKPGRRLVQFGYVTMALFVVIFLALPATFTGYQCTGNYVIFQVRPYIGGFYYVYYFGWLFMTIGLGMRWANQLRAVGKTARTKLQTVQGIILGYLVFLIPAMLANVINPSTRRGIPSIMCGFAVLYALILGLYILPRVGTKRLTKRVKEV